MKKVVLSFLILVLLGCRNEDFLLESIDYQEDISRKFSVFTAQSPNDTIDYAKGFEILAKRYDSLYQENFTGYKDIENWDSKSTIPDHIDFTRKSQVFTNEEGDKWVIFPKIKKGIVSDLVVAYLVEDETIAGFYVEDRNSDFYRQNISLFQKEEVFFNKALTINSICGSLGNPCHIGEVIIIAPRPIAYPPSFPRFGGGGGGSGGKWETPIGGCSMYELCHPDEGGGGGGGYSPPKKDDSNNNDPCRKTKSQITKNPKIQKAINEIKDHANKRTGSEIGRRFHKNGNVSEAPIINNHRLSVGNPNELDGFYHNHTSKGVDIFSPQDVSSLIEIARFQDTGNSSNAFMGVIAYGDIHYVMRWRDDSHLSLPPFGSFSQEKLEDLAKEQWNDFYAVYDANFKNFTKEQRLEVVFYQTLERMGYEIKNNIILQKIDINNNISIIHYNKDGTISTKPCN